MTPFEAIVIAHLVFDILLQPAFIAYPKLTNAWVRAFHCWVMYAPGVAIAWALSWPHPKWSVFAVAYLYIGIMHFLFDSAKSKRWWLHFIRQEDNAPMGLVVLIDQAFHIVTLAFLFALPH